MTQILRLGRLVDDADSTCQWRCQFGDTESPDPALPLHAGHG